MFQSFEPSVPIFRAGLILMPLILQLLEKFECFIPHALHWQILSNCHYEAVNVQMSREKGACITNLKSNVWNQFVFRFRSEINNLFNRFCFLPEKLCLFSSFPCHHDVTEDAVLELGYYGPLQTLRRFSKVGNQGWGETSECGMALRRKEELRK
jgi:hypothetical protein